MTTLEYLLLGWRHKFFILSLTILLTLAGYTYTFLKLKPNYLTTIFVSTAIQINDQNLNSSTYENLQAADLFTETIQGWFKNPNLMKRVETLSGISAEITAKKQEKQNLLISFETADQTQSEKVKKAVWETLNAEINLYNNNSDNKFSLALFNSELSFQTVNTYFYLIISFILGIVIAYLGAYFYEKSQNILMSKRQIYKIFKTKPLFEFKNLKQLEAEQVKFLNVISALYPENDLQFLALFSEVKASLSNLYRQTKRFKKNVKILDTFSELTELNPATPTIIVCRLGQNYLSDLERFKKLKLSKVEIMVFA